MYDNLVQHTNPRRGADAGVHTEGLGKRYGDLWALRDLDLDVPGGTVLGLLGHNGAGKTTTLRILTTLAKPGAGRARVAGFDVATQPGEVRRRIGVAAQQATVDGLLTARANLEMTARLHGLPKAAARRQAGELLDRLGLDDAADRLAKTFSGGMRRRLDLAASLVANPAVLFLDEPTTGLDPRSRGELWDLLRELVAEGTTLILTTQYLDEADRLAHDIVVLDHGRAVAHVTPAALKSRVGTDRIEVTVASRDDLQAAADVLGRLGGAGPLGDAVDVDPGVTVDEGALVVTAAVPAQHRLMEVVRALDEAGVDALDLNRRQSTLDDVFLTLTAARPTPSTSPAPCTPPKREQVPA